MTPERVAELAREAGLIDDRRISTTPHEWAVIHKFAAIIERESFTECARICRELGDFGTYHNVCAAAIERAAKGAGT